MRGDEVYVIVYSGVRRIDFASVVHPPLMSAPAFEISFA
jgi:hypothetical protein